MIKQPKNLPDTNTVVRYLIADEPALHVRAKEFFDEVKQGTSKAIILESVVAECMYVLTKIYKVPRDRAAGSLIDILRYKGIANDDQQALIRALTLCTEHGLDIVDCILCAKAISGGDHLFTFDHALNKLARRA
ncbi:MAG TPA: PIN domain-containing protein [Nitrospirota bacterium]|nr:PIN domain-containing protein [Nitrospirota bacterium]